MVDDGELAAELQELAVVGDVLAEALDGDEGAAPAAPVHLRRVGWGGCVNWGWRLGIGVR